jgi:hypothetical protein
VILEIKADFMDLLGIIIYSFLGALILGLGYTLWLLFDILPVTVPSARSSGKVNRRSSDSEAVLLERKLLTLVGGARAIATRLLVSIRFKNPSKSKKWCYEKAIYDLQRDRRAI